jgi:hypothetical protein
MATQAEQLTRSTIAAQLKTPVHNHEPMARYNISEGAMVRIMGDRRHYSSQPLDPAAHHDSEPGREGLPVHWLALVPTLRMARLSMNPRARRFAGPVPVAGELAVVEFGIDVVDTDIAYDRTSERRMLREDLQRYRPKMKPDMAEFYRHIQGAVVRRVCEEGGHPFLAALERRIPEEAEGDIMQAQTHLVMPTELPRSVGAVVNNYVESHHDSHSPVPLWLEQAYRTDNQNSLAKMAAFTALQGAMTT